jgi:transposase
MKKCRLIRYSESFKLQVIKEYDESNLTFQDLRLKYGIKGSETIQCWLRKYKREDLLNKIVRVEKPGEKSRLKELAKENQQLKIALADAHIKQVISESFLEVMCEELGLTMEEVKKKYGKK